MAFVAEAVVDLPRDLEDSFHVKRSPNSVVDLLAKKGDRREYSLGGFMFFPYIVFFFFLVSRVVWSFAPVAFHFQCISLLLMNFS